MAMFTGERVPVGVTYNVTILPELRVWVMTTVASASDKLAHHVGGSRLGDLAGGRPENPN